MDNIAFVCFGILIGGLFVYCHQQGAFSFLGSLFRRQSGEVDQKPVPELIPISVHIQSTSKHFGQHGVASHWEPKEGGEPVIAAHFPNGGTHNDHSIPSDGYFVFDDMGGEGSVVIGPVFRASYRIAPIGLKVGDMKSLAPTHQRTLVAAPIEAPSEEDKVAQEYDLFEARPAGKR